MHYSYKIKWDFCLAKTQCIFREIWAQEIACKSGQHMCDLCIWFLPKNQIWCDAWIWQISKASHSYLASLCTANSHLHWPAKYGSSNQLLGLIFQQKLYYAIHFLLRNKWIERKHNPAALPFELHHFAPEKKILLPSSGGPKFVQKGKMPWLGTLLCLIN